MTFVEHHQADILKRLRLQRLQHETSLRCGDDDLGQFEDIRESNLFIEITYHTEIAERILERERSLIDKR